MILEVENIDDQNHIFTVSSKIQNNSLKLDHLSETETLATQNLYEEYSDVFKQPDQFLTCTNKVKHEIPILLDQNPINQKPYRLPEAQNQSLKNRSRIR